MTFRFAGVSSLLFHQQRLILEVRKRHKWHVDDDGRTIIGVGGIGGTMEAGETPLQGLRRETHEEVGCDIGLRSAQRTLVSTGDGTTIEQGIVVDGLCPAMVWQIIDPPYDVGAFVAVFLARAEQQPQPGDLPAILMADLEWAQTVHAGDIDLRDAVSHGVDVHAQTPLPDDAILQPVNTWRRVLEVRSEFPDLFAEWLHTW